MRTFDELLESYSPDVQELARSARKFVLSQLRGAQETVDASGPYIGYGFAGGYKGQACSLILSKGGVKLGIVGGAFFDDPHRLLQATQPQVAALLAAALHPADQRGQRGRVDKMNLGQAHHDQCTWAVVKRRSDHGRDMGVETAGNGNYADRACRMDL